MKLGKKLLMFVACCFTLLGVSFGTKVNAATPTAGATDAGYGKATLEGATITDAVKYKNLDYSFLKKFNWGNTSGDTIIAVYNTFADMMKCDSRLLPGAHVRTRGYYSVGDGGAAEYVIETQKADTLTYELPNGYFANLVADQITINGEKFAVVSIKQAGAKPDGSESATAAFNLAVVFANKQAATENFDRGIVYIPEGEYKVTNEMHCSAKHISIVGEGDKSVFFTDNDYRKADGYSEHLFQCWNSESCFYGKFRVEAREIDLYHYMRQFSLFYCKDVYIYDLDLVVPEEAYTAYFYQDKQYSNFCCYTGNTNITVDGCYFEQMSGTYRGANLGILDIWSACEKNITVMNCELVGNARDEQIGFFSTYRDTAGVENVDFINNKITSYSPRNTETVGTATMRFTVAYQDSNDIKDIRIAGNHFISECDSKFMTFGKGTGIVVEQNVIEVYKGKQSGSMLFDSSNFTDDGVVIKNNEFYISSYDGHCYGNICGGSGYLNFSNNTVLSDVQFIYGVYGTKLNYNKFITFALIGSNQGQGYAVVNSSMSECTGNEIIAYRGLSQIGSFYSGAEDAVLNFTNNTVYDYEKNLSDRGTWTALFLVRCKADTINVLNNKIYAPNKAFQTSSGDRVKDIDANGNVIDSLINYKKNDDGTKTYYNRLFYYRAADGANVSNFNVKNNVFQGAWGFTYYGGFTTKFDWSNNTFIDTTELASDKIADSIKITSGNKETENIGTVASSLQLGANVYIDNAKVTDRKVYWYSSAPSIASVNANGLVTKHQNGSVYIYAVTQDGTRTYAKCKVTFEAAKATAINLEDKEISLQVGWKNYVDYTVLPANAENAVIFESTNTDIATVNVYGLVKAVSIGECEVLVKTVDGSGIVARVKIHVTENMVRRVDMSKSYLELERSMIGKTYQLTAKYVPEDAVNKGIERWESTNEKVATVDNNGLVTIKGQGTANIIAYSIDGFHYGKTSVFVQNEAVKNLKVLNRNKTEITLTWDAVDNTYGYYIYKYDSSTSTYECINSDKYTTSTNYKITGLDPNTSYKFMVKPFLSNWTTGSRRLIEGVAATVSTSTTNYNTVVDIYPASSTNVTLCLSDASRNKKNVYFKYSKAADTPDLDFTVSIKDPSILNVERVANGADYQPGFKITALKTGFTTVTITCNDENKKSITYNVAVVNGIVDSSTFSVESEYGKTTVKFAGLKDESGITGYCILRTKGTIVLYKIDYVPATGADTYTYVDTTGEDGKSYSYSVCACYYDGNDYYYNSEYRENYHGHATKFPALIPTEMVSLNKKTIVLSAGTSTSIAATIAPTDVTYKTVDWYSDNNNIATVKAASNKNNATVTAKKIGVTEIGGYALDGTHKFGKTVVVVCNSMTTPTLKAGDSTITISWKSSEGANGYNIYRYNGSSYVKIGSTTKLTYTDSNLKPVIEYKYKVIPYFTYNGVNYEGQASQIAAAVTSITLAKPVIASLKNIDKGLSITWNKVSDAKGYYIYRKTNAGWTLIKTINGNTAFNYIDTTATAGVTYTYGIKAFYGSYTSALSEVKAYKRLVPGTIKVENAANGMKISWTKATGADTYMIFRRKVTSTWSTGWSWVKNTKDLSAIDTTAEDGSTYDYVIKAISGDYQSGLSNIFNCTRVGTPTVTVAKVTNGIKVTISKVSSANKYMIYRKTATSGWTFLKTTAAGVRTYTDTTAKTGQTYIYGVIAINSAGLKSVVSSSAAIKR